MSIPAPLPAARRAQSPHEAMSLMDRNGDSYYLKLDAGLFNIISHGPDWVCIVRDGLEGAPAMWRQWRSLEGRFTIEGDYDPMEKGWF